jgi:PAS domain S-box-containing protein
MPSDPVSFFSSGSSLLASPSSPPDIGRLTSLQSQVDGLVGSFAQQAADWRSLASMMMGGMAYRMGRVGVMSTGVRSSQILSVGIGLGAEVTAFEMTNRSLTSLTGGSSLNPNLWRWEGQGGIRQGLLSSLVTFGSLKGAGRLAQGENVVVQHLLQDTGMVLGHQISGAFEITPRPRGSLIEQFLHAEATNLQLGAGMALGHSLTGGRIMVLERGMDLSFKFFDPSEEKLPEGQPPDYIESGETPFQFAHAWMGAGTIGRCNGNPTSVGPSLEHIALAVKDERLDSTAPSEEPGTSGIHVRKTPVRGFSVRKISTERESVPSSDSEDGEGAVAKIPTLPSPILTEQLPSAETRPPPSSSFPFRAALAASEARYATLLKALPDPIIMLDRDGNFLHVHAERDDLLFLPAEELLGTSIQNLPYPFELREFGMSVIRRALESGEIQRVEYTVPWRDGTTHIQEARVVPDVQPDGSEAVLVIVRDVTRERRAEEIHVAAERLEALQRFSQGVAHDLNNLMVGIENYARFGARNLQNLQHLARMASEEGFSENPTTLRTFQEQLARSHKLLTRDSQTPEASASQRVSLMALQAAQVFERMMKDQGTVIQQSERIRSLLSDLKELGETPKEGPPFDLHILLEEERIRAFLDRTENLEGQPEELVRDLVSDPWLVPGFQGNISRMIENLVGNARDAMDGRAHRRLTIRTDKVTVTEEGLAQVTYPPIGPNVKPGNFMRLSVEDTGQGIDETILKQIFEPFFTTKRRLSSGTSGSGLGLAITLSAIQNTRGFITVKSEQDVGTIFEIYLPQMGDSLSSKAAPVPETVPELPLQERVLKTPILIVDDESILVKAMKRVLEEAGFETVLAKETASEAIAHTENYGLALLDINLHDMNGVKLMGRLKENRPDLPFIFVTGGDHAGHARHLQEGSSLRILSKPYKNDELIAMVKGMIEASLQGSRGSE